MAKILAVSHSPLLNTGYGRVIGRLAEGFVGAGHHVTVIGMGDHQPGAELPYRLVPIGARPPEDAIVALIAAGAPDVLFTLGDPWMFELVPQIADLCTVTWISYVALDGFPVPPEWTNWIGFCDVPVVFTAWAQSLIAGATGSRPTAIPHGIDTSLFAPADKSAAKDALGIAPGTFVVGCVAMNQQRKNLSALIKAFAVFAHDRDDVFLFLHTQPQGFWDIPALFRRYGLESRAMVTPALRAGQAGVSDEQLVTIYNAFDVFCLPTMAEGFGLPILESQSCGVPALVTNFSACSELVANPVQLLGVRATLVMNRGLEQAIVDEIEIAAKLEYFYHRRQDLPLLGAQCRRFAERFDWSLVLPNFLKLIESAPARPKEASLRLFAI